MTTLDHRNYREKKGFPDLTIPNELLLEYSLGGELYSSFTRKFIGQEDPDIEVSMFLSRPSQTWRIFIHEKGFGGCCLVDTLTKCKTAQQAILILSSECKRVFKKEIQLELQKV
jgi:hypothetical protein